MLLALTEGGVERSAITHILMRRQGCDLGKQDQFKHLNMRVVHVTRITLDCV